MEEFKGTPGEWVADIRGGCAAIYQKEREDDTPGCHPHDERNIAYSCKGAKFNGNHWELDPSVEHDFKVMAAAPKLLAALHSIVNEYEKECGLLSDLLLAIAESKAVICEALGK